MGKEKSLMRSDRKTTLNPLIPLALSVIAVLLSSVSIYLVQFNKGSLKILLPDKMAIGLNSSGKIAIVLPLTFTSTGAPRQGIEVLKVWIDVFSTSEPGQALTAYWMYESAYMHRLEFLKNYPEEKDRDTGQEDFLVYSKRAFPFHLEGGKSTSKAYYLLQSNGNLPDKNLGILILTIHVKTDNGVIERSVKYDLGNKTLDRGFTYAMMVDEET